MSWRWEQRRSQETGQEWKGLRRGWCYGDTAFRQELLEQVQAQAGENHYGRERQESAEEQGERIVREEMLRLGWNEEQLAQRLKGDRGKVCMARRLRSETTVSLKWIARRLQMGTWTHVTNRLYHLRP